MDNHSKNATVSITLKAESGYKSEIKGKITPYQWGLINRATELPVGIEIKKVFRASYGDESRIMLIIAKDIDEAIKLTNDKIIDETFGLEQYDEENDKDKLPFIFDNKSVIEIDLKQDSQILEDLTADSF